VEIAFFQNCTIMIVLGCLAPFFAVVPAVTAVPNLFTAALLGLVSMMMMSWAYARAPTSTLIPVEYTAFAWAALLGWLDSTRRSRYRP
jgi:S-adenosylmethionine uptake transporter